MFVCSTLTIAWFLGSLPPKGVVITVPRSALVQYSDAQLKKAAHCAAKHHIKYRIDEAS